MIQILITAALILGFLKLTDKENVIDYFGAFAIYIAPLAAVWVMAIAIDSFELPQFLHVLIYAAFFIVPYLIINAICESYTTKKKALLSSGVFAIVLVTQVVQVVVTSGFELQVG